MSESLIKFTNRKLLERWDESPFDRFMIIAAFLIYPMTLFIAWTCKEDDQ